MDENFFDFEALRQKLGGSGLELSFERRGNPLDSCWVVSDQQTGEVVFRYHPSAARGREMRVIDENGAVVVRLFAPSKALSERFHSHQTEDLNCLFDGLANHIIKKHGLEP